MINQRDPWFQGLSAAGLAWLIQSVPAVAAAANITPWQSTLPPTASISPWAEDANRLDAERLGPSVTADASAPLIEVRTILTEGSTVFSPEVLAEAVAPFEGRTLTFEDLQGAANAVTQLYLNAGYITSEAVLLPQAAMQGGVISLQVVEGGLEEIRVVGTDRLVSYVQQRIALAGTRPLNQNQLEGQLQLLKRDPLFDNVEASLRQGQTDGSSILTVQVTEAPALSGSLAIDTLSPRSVGEFRTGGTLQYNNLAGWGDRLVASVYRSTTGATREAAEAWLKQAFEDEPPFCQATDLHSEFVTSSTKHADGRLAQVFLCYAEADSDGPQDLPHPSDLTYFPAPSSRLSSRLRY